MKTDLTCYTVGDICEGFEYSEAEEKGLFGLSGKLIIQPEYQRNYFYATNNKDKAVIETLLGGCLVGLFHFNQREDGKLEVLDGQQRITSIGRYLADKFSVTDRNGMPQIFSSLTSSQQELIKNARVPVVMCSGTEEEIKDWFQKVNTETSTPNKQEMLNCVYSGPFVSAGRPVFSKMNGNAYIQKWNSFIRGDAQRQYYWERALQWVSNDNISEYMSRNRRNGDISQVCNHFDKVLNWASSVFLSTEKEMVNLEWGRLYSKYHDQSYDPINVQKRVKELYSDPYVKSRRGIFEFILGGETDRRLLDIRMFDEATKRSVYASQTENAEKEGVSNCPLCAIGNNSNKDRIWKIGEMDADHVTAWSKGGETDASNCQMLCKTHNRAKGNR